MRQYVTVPSCLFSLWVTPAGYRQRRTEGGQPLSPFVIGLDWAGFEILGMLFNGVAEPQSSARAYKNTKATLVAWSALRGQSSHAGVT